MPDVTLRLRALWVAVAVVSALQVSNNLLPYIGMRDDSCQTMFSGLDWHERHNNHLVMPQHMLTDWWVFYIDVDADVSPEPTGRSREIVDWLRRDGLQHNAEAIRVGVRQLCDDGIAVHLWVRRVGGPLEDIPDACADPRFSAPHWWIPVRLYDSHYPYPFPPVGEAAG
ncbi:MAG: hypothetical protein AB8I08_25855 [Sandaracinaceae bacterium]